MFVFFKKRKNCWSLPSVPIIRYGENNPCFSVASFSNNDEEDKDVAKKVTSALERVTSDYHSGSSSDEDSMRTSPLTIPNSRCAYQVLHNTLSFLWLNIPCRSGKTIENYSIITSYFSPLFDAHWLWYCVQMKFFYLQDLLIFVSFSKAMNPAAPSWHPKKMVPGNGHIVPRPHYSFRPRSRAPHTLRPNLWVPPGYRGGPGYWDTNQNLAHCYS